MQRLPVRLLELAAHAERGQLVSALLLMLRAAAAQVSLVDDPQFSYSLMVSGGDLSFLPGLEAFISSFVRTAVLRPYVLPEGLRIPLSPEAAALDAPKGILFVKLLGADNVPWLDWCASGLLLSLNCPARLTPVGSAIAAGLCLWPSQSRSDQLSLLAQNLGTHIRCMSASAVAVTGRRVQLVQDAQGPHSQQASAVQVVTNRPVCKAGRARLAPKAQPHAGQQPESQVRAAAVLHPMQTVAGPSHKSGSQVPTAATRRRQQSHSSFPLWHNVQGAGAKAG